MNAIVDAVADDCLGQLQLKPWWESWREYAYKTSIAVIVLFAFFDKSKFNCLPINSDPADFTEVQAAVVDSMCGSKAIPWYILRGDLIATGMSIMTYVLSNYWIHESGNMDKLTDLSRFGRSTLEMNMSAEEMQNAAVLPITCSSGDKRYLLRQNVQILLKYRCHATLSRSYTRRCFAVMVWTGICSGAVLWASIAEIRHPSTVPCEITDTFLQLGLRNTSKSFVCLDKATLPTALLELIFACTLLLQFFSMVVALWKQKTAITHDIVIPTPGNRRHGKNAPRDRTTNIQDNNVSDARTFLIHMMGIDRRQAKKIKSFTSFIIFSDEFPCKLQEYSDEAIIAGDVEYFRILKKRISAKKFWEEVKGTANVVLREGDRKVEVKKCKKTYEEPVDYDYLVHIFLDRVFRIAFEKKELQFDEGNTNDESTVQLDAVVCSSFMNNQQIYGNNGEKMLEDEKFVRNLIKTSNWHLLFCCPLTFDKPELFANVKSDVLDCEGRSCLFYALRRSSMDKLLSRFVLFDQVISEISSTNRKLIHFDGISMTPEDFFYENYPEMYRGKLPDFRLCGSAELDSSSNECEKELEEIFVKYQNRFDEKSASSRLGRLKLSRVDGDIAIKLVKMATQNKHWEIVIGLINTFIVVHEHGKRPTFHNLMRNDTFDLRESPHLKEICVEALKRPRCKTYFIPTAAEHILSIMGKDIKKEMLTFISRSRLTNETKERLAEIANRH